MDILQELADRARERELDIKEFKKDAKKAYFEYIKKLNPETWWWKNISWFSYPPIIFGWTIYIKNSPIWGCSEHWFNKKWDIAPTRFVHEFKVRRVGSNYEGFDV